MGDVYSHSEYLAQLKKVFINRTKPQPKSICFKLKWQKEVSLDKNQRF